MYGWIWRHLPGNTLVRAFLSVLLALGAVFLLFQYVFPWAEPLLPFGESSIGDAADGGAGGGDPGLTPAESPSAGPADGSAGTEPSDAPSQTGDGEATTGDAGGEEPVLGGLGELTDPAAVPAAPAL
ncbi:hypothetical protein FHU37_002325 [Allostreptomyces psammosilenae]|uniref:Uncharacterized protein n=1 Tax=Allostreptomyces psammosilenae TaxID=1892865 RepID=A0A853A4F4_9ACTN|nr:hypothetical protein [Allostreptomyces psammosilenae]NYI05382.1 hypothetical protein [Allostreptomyces psammosilenae]